ncbi:SH3 domain-containing protein [Streptomyces sp. SAJ15]|uniref:SH3 domain-containing protein n=1 Tax=Streptomyces sp. SAJ15 TaxID=2011095 RepID=UPI0011856AD2|nr:SH3 domain-containing protein [Streptomyces sp. SAJ15]TVL92101.1 SH3 domain-containing protein [Streptomyces sp. SAJ15]
MAMEEAVEESVAAEAGVESVETMAAAESVTYPVAPGHRVNVRRGPSTTSPLVKVLPYDARVPIRCQRRGERVSGPYGTTDVWDNIAPGQFVSDAFVKTGSDGFVAPQCG